MTQKREQRATWRGFADIAAETVGFGSPIHRAADDAAKGKQEAEAKFYEALSQLKGEQLLRYFAGLQGLENNPPANAKRYAAVSKI